MDFERKNSLHVSQSKKAGIWGIYYQQQLWIQAPPLEDASLEMNTGFTFVKKQD